MEKLSELIEGQVFSVGAVEVELKTSSYANGRVCIDAVYAADTRNEETGRTIAFEGDRFALLTVNLPDVEIPEAYAILVRSHDHSEALYERVLHYFGHVFRDTGEQVSAGGGEIANIWHMSL